MSMSLGRFLSHGWSAVILIFSGILLLLFCCRSLLLLLLLLSLAVSCCCCCCFVSFSVLVISFSCLFVFLFALTFEKAEYRDTSLINYQ